MKPKEQVDPEPHERNTARYDRRPRRQRSQCRFSNRTSPRPSPVPADAPLRLREGVQLNLRKSQLREHLEVRLGCDVEPTHFRECGGRDEQALKKTINQRNSSARIANVDLSAADKIDFSGRRAVQFNPYNRQKIFQKARSWIKRGGSSWHCTAVGFCFSDG